MFTILARVSALFLYKYILVAAVIDRLFSLTVFRQSSALRYGKLFSKAKHLLGSPTGYSLEREMSAKLTEGCRLSKAVERSETERGKESCPQD